LAKEKEERGRTGIDRESKVTNAKVIVLLSHPVERIYRVPCDDTLAFPRSARRRTRRRSEAKDEAADEKKERGRERERDFSQICERNDENHPWLAAKTGRCSPSDETI